MEDSVYAYYPGCTLHSTAREYDVSARLVCQALGIELHELRDWACCGASSAHSTSQLLGLVLPARELRMAEEMKLPLAVACAMCYSRLKFTADELGNRATLELIGGIVGGDHLEAVEVVHLLKVLEDRVVVPPKRPLAGLRVACYYGCLLARPLPVVAGDDTERPQAMDRLMQALGAETVDWDFKTECCGASLPLTRRDIVVTLSHRLLSHARQLGADCIAVACPMCHSNLDCYQREQEMPVLYFTQLLGLALGFSPRELLLNRHFTDPIPMLRAKGLV